MDKVVREAKARKKKIPDPTSNAQLSTLPKHARKAGRHGCYLGLKGLRLGQQEALADYEKTGEVPRAHDFPGIKTALMRGHWIPQRIVTWKGFLASIDLKPRCEIGKWDDDRGLDQAIRQAEDYLKEFGKPPARISSGFGGIVGAIERGAWINLPSKRCVPTWPAFLMLAGMKMRFSDLMRMASAWERLCETIAQSTYGDCEPQKTLPNGKIPDLVFSNENGDVVIADAKISSFTEGVEETIQTYIAFCDKMEIWHFTGRPRSPEIHEGKQVFFLYPSQILNRVTNNVKRKELKKALRELRQECETIARMTQLDKQKMDGVQKLDRVLDENEK